VNASQWKKIHAQATALLPGVERALENLAEGSHPESALEVTLCAIAQAADDAARAEVEARLQMLIPQHDVFAVMTGFARTVTEAFNAVITLNQEVVDRLTVDDKVPDDPPYFALHTTAFSCAILLDEQVIWSSENDEREVDDDRGEPVETIEAYLRRKSVVYACRVLDALATEALRGGSC
jgi:hypothetical protein